MAYKKSKGMKPRNVKCSYSSRSTKFSGWAPKGKMTTRRGLTVPADRPV